MNFEIKVSWDSTPCREVVADVSMNYNYCPVETAKCLKSLECAATPSVATRIWPSYSMTGDHALMIHYEEQNQKCLYRHVHLLYYKERSFLSATLFIIHYIYTYVDERVGFVSRNDARI